jgi:branched-chain amino acid aminotransferase
MPNFINYNGKLLNEDEPVVNAASRGLRYGDGCFETLKLLDHEIRLETLHFERLFGTLERLQFKVPAHLTPEFLKEQIHLVCKKNNLLKAARVRLNLFRKGGGLYGQLDHSPEFVVEVWDLPENYFHLNENGLIVDIYTEARKPCDRFSNLKSNNYLPYVMGALYAKQNKLNDCLILNSYDRICDASIANVFWVHDQIIYTPPLAEGGVAGVMRRHLLQILPGKGYSVKEKNLELSDLKEAEELFLTNAISGIRWVKQFQDKEYTNNLSTGMYSLLC